MKWKQEKAGSKPVTERKQINFSQFDICIESLNVSAGIIIRY